MGCSLRVVSRRAVRNVLHEFVSLMTLTQTFVGRTVSLIVRHQLLKIRCWAPRLFQNGQKYKTLFTNDDQVSKKKTTTTKFRGNKRQFSQCSRNQDQEKNHNVRCSSFETKTPFSTFEKKRIKFRTNNKRGPYLYSPYLLK